MEHIILSNPEQSEYYSPVTYGVGVQSPTPEVNLQEYIDSLLSNILDKLYPIGSHYITTSKDNPGILFNFGTWEMVEEKKTLLGANSTYPLNSKGGYENVTLTVAQLPSHRHSVNRRTFSRYDESSGGTKDFGRSGVSSGASTNATGNGQSHNNMQPYIKVIVWKRVK